MFYMLDYSLTQHDAQFTSATRDAYPRALTTDDRYAEFMNDFTEFCSALSIVSRDLTQLTEAWDVGTDFLRDKWTDAMPHLIATMVTLSISDYLAYPHKSDYAPWSARGIAFAIALDSNLGPAILMPRATIRIDSLIADLVRTICDAFGMNQYAHFGIYQYKTRAICARHADTYLLHYSRHRDRQTMNLSNPQVHVSYGNPQGYGYFSARANVDIRATTDETAKCALCEKRAAYEMKMYAFSSVAIFIFDNDIIGMNDFEPMIVLPTITHVMDARACPIAYLIHGMYQLCGIVSQCGQEYGALISNPTRDITDIRAVCSLARAAIVNGAKRIAVYNLTNMEYVIHECPSQVMRAVQGIPVHHDSECTCRCPSSPCSRDDDEPSVKIAKH
jgi:hypothetical protein